MTRGPDDIIFKRALAAHEIANLDVLLAGEIGYYPRALCQIAFPSSNFTGNEYARQSGPYHLSIQAPALFGVPWGIYPRGIVTWMSTEVVLKKNQGEDSRTLDLGKSLGEFITKISGTTSYSGGKYGNIRPFKKQLLSLLSSRIFYWYDQDSEALPLQSMEIVSSGNLLWHPKMKDEPGLFQSQVVLGEAFHADLVKSAVPLDTRIMRAIWPNCLAFDIYIWLTYRAKSMEKQGRVLMNLKWNSLKLQFGHSYKDMRSFRMKFLAALKLVSMQYKAMSFEEKSGEGITFKLLRPSVRSVQVIDGERRQLPDRV